jgi:nucleotide-binding universal stress UspA family protein
MTAVRGAGKRSRSGSPRRSRPCMVLGYDRTDSARHAARWVADELPADGRLVIVHASRPLHAPPSPFSTPQERRRFGRALVDELLLEGDDALFDLDVAVEVSDAGPVTALIDAARRHGARAIVVGSERHSRLHKALGTVTTELLKSSPVPVIAVPATAARRAGSATRRSARAPARRSAKAATEPRPAKASAKAAGKRSSARPSAKAAVGRPSQASAKPAAKAAARRSSTGPSAKAAPKRPSKAAARPAAKARPPAKGAARRSSAGPTAAGRTAAGRTAAGRSASERSVTKRAAGRPRGSR